MKRLPRNDDIFGFKNLSNNHPQNGATIAYTPPFITKTAPNTIGLKLKSLKCGSNVALKKLIDALVALIANAFTKIPGIFNACFADPKIGKNFNSRSEIFYIILNTSIK